MIEQENVANPWWSSIIEIWWKALLAALLFVGSTAFCSRDRNTGTMHFCRGGIQINFIIFLFQFVNIYVGSRITITPFSFIIAVLFLILFLILSHVYPFCFFQWALSLYEVHLNMMNQLILSSNTCVLFTLMFFSWHFELSHCQCTVFYVLLNIQ